MPCQQFFVFGLAHNIPSELMGGQLKTGARQTATASVNEVLEIFLFEEMQWPHMTCNKL